MAQTEGVQAVSVAVNKVVAVARVVTRVGRVLADAQRLRHYQSLGRLQQ